MEGAVYLIVFTLIFLESAIYSGFPFYAIALSFLGYMVFKKELYALIFAIIIAFIIGGNGSHIEEEIIFFIIFVVVLNNVFKNIYFEKINILLITIIEVAMYLLFIYFFKAREIQIFNWIKELIFVLLYNFIFARMEKNLSR